MSTKKMVFIAILILILFYYFSEEIVSFVSDVMAKYLR